MMAHKKNLLQELLKEDQEPFLLNKYISDRRSQIKRPSPNTSLQLKKHRKQPLHHHHHHHHLNKNSSTTLFPVNLCKNACLFSFPKDTTKSPLFELPSPAPPVPPTSRSPCKSPNAIFLHIPSRTAAVLLEAALRIHKNSKPNHKPQSRTNGFGLFGSFFKRLTQRDQSRKRKIESKPSVKDVFNLDSGVGRRKLRNGSRKHQHERAPQRDNVGNASACEIGFRCSYNIARASSAVWSEDKSLDMETSSSTNSSHSYDGDDDSDDEIIGFVNNHKHDRSDCSCCHDDTNNGFCESPFRFVLQRSPSSGRNTPELASPAPSPSRHRTQDKESNGAESLNKFQSGEEEEDKEQCSPVSVLDPPFEDDDDGHGNDDDHEEEEEEEEEDDDFNLECSYAIVQRAKQQLLYKLRRFEKLAGLDPVELEKTMLDDEEDDEDGTFMEEDGSEGEASGKEDGFRELAIEALCQSSVHERLQIPEGLKKLVSDLIVEERRELSSLEERDMVVRKVCKRLELWKEVVPNTIDMMIEEDFSREDVGWKKNVEQMRDMAGELEVAIFGFLVEEFSEELGC